VGPHPHAPAVAYAPDLATSACLLSPRLWVINILAQTVPTISHHTKVLAEAGLIRGEKAGRWVNWSVVPERVAALGAVLAP